MRPIFVSHTQRVVEKFLKRPREITSVSLFVLCISLSWHKASRRRESGEERHEKLLFGSVASVALIAANAAASAADMGLPAKARTLEPAWTPTSIHDSLRWFGTVRGRAGLALDNVLMYLTAGLAYDRTNHTEIDGAPASLNADLSVTKVGFAAGVGTECGLEPHWSVKAEVLYVDLGKSSTTIGPFSGGISGRFDTLDTMWIVRAGVNYKFGG